MLFYDPSQLSFTDSPFCAYQGFESLESKAKEHLSFLVQKKNQNLNCASKYLLHHRLNFLLPIVSLILHWFLLPSYTLF